jgi:protein gp37
VSIEDQKTAGQRLGALMATLAAVRWASAEPLLNRIDVEAVRVRCTGCTGWRSPLDECCEPGQGRLDWVVTGGETGSGRPSHPDWFRLIRDQCVAAGVPFYFKQWGDFKPATVFDAPGFAGGRAYDSPKGGRTATCIRGAGRASRPMEPGDRTTGGVVMLDQDTVAVRVGAKAAGRELDGRTWDQMPEVCHA